MNTEKDKEKKEIPPGNRKTALSDEEKERIKEKNGSRPLTLKKWTKAVSKYWLD